MDNRTKINVWYDKEGDFLDVGWGRSTSTVPTADDRVMAHIDDEGNIQGFHIVGLRGFEGNFLDVDIQPIETKSTTI